MDLEDLIDKIGHLDDPPPVVVTLKAKKLACLVKIPNDLLKFSSPDVELIVRRMFDEQP